MNLVEQKNNDIYFEFKSSKSLKSVLAYHHLLFTFGNHLLKKITLIYEVTIN